MSVAAFARRGPRIPQTALFGHFLLGGSSSTVNPTVWDIKNGGCARCIRQHDRNWRTTNSGPTGCNAQLAANAACIGGKASARSINRAQRLPACELSGGSPEVNLETMTEGQCCRLGCNLHGAVVCKGLG
jgi:hypothetical protein